MKGLFITGTDTGVGKTAVGAAVAAALHRGGRRVYPRKPVESGCAASAEGPRPADGLAYHHAVARLEPLDRITPIRLHAALAAPLAARREGLHLHLAELQAAAAAPADGLLLVEGAGGFYSPIAEDGLNADLAERLGLPLLVVAADRLGCISQVLLVLEAAERRGLQTAAVVLNRCRAEDAENTLDNAAALREHTRVPVCTVPWAGTGRPPVDGVLAALGLAAPA